MSHRPVDVQMTCINCPHTQKEWEISEEGAIYSWWCTVKHMNVYIAVYRPLSSFLVKDYNYNLLDILLDIRHYNCKYFPVDYGTKETTKQHKTLDKFL